jgi:hypothetical protein
MGREIIVLEEKEIQDQPILTLFDDKLRQALTAKSSIVAVCMRPEIECATEVLEWLEAWNRRFSTADKSFFIVPATAIQLECLEVSHPDMALRYVSTLDELDIVARHIENRIAQPEVPLLQPVTFPLPNVEHRAASEPAAQQIVYTQQPAPPPVDIYTAPEEKRTTPAIDNSTAYVAPSVHMAAGSKVWLAGEYVCSSCKISRMWLKGDKAANCENPECRNPSAGWNLTYELF